MTTDWHEPLREWAENGGRGIAAGLPESVLTLLDEIKELENCLTEALEEWGEGKLAYPTHNWIAKTRAALKKEVTE